MRKFDEIFDLAANRKGGVDELEKLLDPPAGSKELAAIADDRWLAMMTKCIFQAGFNWKVVESMWPGFEEAFHGFDIGRNLMMSDDDLNALVSNKKIVRHGAKISTVPENARFISELNREHGGAGKFFASWPSSDYVGLLEILKKRGVRLGGNTGMYFLRFMNVDSFILSKDVVARLIAEGVVDKQPGSKSSMRAVQDAFNEWADQSDRSLKTISRVLAMSVG